MSEKYIELHQAIFSDLRDRGMPIAVSIGDVLEWLDEHPDQVPGGRTVTERVKITDTEAYELYQSARSFSLDDFKLALESIDGIETVDDPEPSDVEKITRLILENSTDMDPKFIAEMLVENGVRPVKAGSNDG